MRGVWKNAKRPINVKVMNKDKKKKKEKMEYIDDGHTIYSMENLVGKENYNKEEKHVGLTRKEKRAAIIGAFETYLPVLLAILICFSLAGALLYFWLN